jgi:hypothetical protein
MPLTDPIKRRLYDRERKRKQREDASRIEEINRLRKELNGILPVVLATYGSYQISFPKASYKTYLEELRKFKKLKQPKKQGYPVEFEVNKYPLRSDDCIKFRAMLTGFWEKDPFFCADHDVSCSTCNQWRVRNKAIFKPFSMW